MKYFFIGEPELVLAFSLVGIEGVTAVNRNEALDAFNKVTGNGGLHTGVIPIDERPKVLILTETVADMIEEEILQWQMKGDYPLVVEIPGIHGSIAGRKSLTDSIREAVGIHV